VSAAVSGRLDVGEGHQLPWRLDGAPDGRPAAALHGGPGSGCSPAQLDLFDLGRWRLLRYDQRGCGEASPHAADDPSVLQTIDLRRQIDDLETMRRHLGVERWTVMGGSWGTCLAVAYALAHRERVEALVLAGVAMCRPVELDFLYWTSGLLLPEAHAAFRAAAPEAADGAAIAAAYLPLLVDPDPKTHQPAADAWCAWEAAVVGAPPGVLPSGRWADPRFRLGFARQCAHAFSRGAWLGDRDLAAEARAFGDLPGRLIHARFDLSAPLDTAWRMAQAWPGARLSVLDSGVHAATAPGMREAVRAETDALWQTLREHRP